MTCAYDACDVNSSKSKPRQFSSVHLTYVTMYAPLHWLPVCKRVIPVYTIKLARQAGLTSCYSVSWTSQLDVCSTFTRCLFDVCSIV